MRKPAHFVFGLALLCLFLQAGCSTTSTPELQTGALQVSSDEEGGVVVTAPSGADLLSSSLPVQVAFVDGTAISDFDVDRSSVEEQAVEDTLGEGKEWVFTGAAQLAEGQKLIRTTRLTRYEDYPELLVFKTTYVNGGEAPVTIDSLILQQYELHSSVTASSDQPTFWSFQGASYPTRDDWVLPLGADSTYFRGAVQPSQRMGGQDTSFERYNYMGMNATDYGGGIPIVDVWTPEGGVAIGHLSTTPELVALPVHMIDERAARIRLVDPHPHTLAPGDSLHGLPTFVRYHEGDFYSTLRTYADIMARQGLKMPTFPETAYEPIWCAWGYGRDFETESILATIPKVKELGLEWVVLDDGWQVAEGSWVPHPERFPRGDASMKAFVDSVHAAGLKAKLWWVPLAADAGSNIAEEHPDWFIQNKDGTRRKITWWDSYYLCPAVPAVRAYTRDLISHFIEDWGFDGLKIDGHNLNAVPRCYNPSHNHRHPTASVKSLPWYFKAIYDRAQQINPTAVIELCPCGDVASYFNMPFNNQPVASDPTSSWQVRLKGKAFKALMGPRTPYYGDHVELSDGGDDFASTVGIGGVPGTKFTWAPPSKIDDAPWMEKEAPRQLRLTPEKAAHWKKWIGLYNELQLAQGLYRGDLYDIGYDLPEAHPIAKDGSMYYAFYADRWQGPIELRGLESGAYRVWDYVNDRSLGVVEGPVGKLNVSFEEHLLLEVHPVQ